MSTLHRRDINGTDFRLLARFCRALQNLNDENGRLPYVLGEIEMYLPVWSLGQFGWQLAGYKSFDREALGIERADMRRICRYLRVHESSLVDTLFRLSMLAVIPPEKICERPRFRMEFLGTCIDHLGLVPPQKAMGFIVERRRSEGHFRTSIGDPITGNGR